MSKGLLSSCKTSACPRVEMRTALSNLQFYYNVYCITEVAMCVNPLSIENSHSESMVQAAELVASCKTARAAISACSGAAAPPQNAMLRTRGGNARRAAGSEVRPDCSRALADGCLVVTFQVPIDTTVVRCGPTSEPRKRHRLTVGRSAVGRSVHVSPCITRPRHCML